MIYLVIRLGANRDVIGAFTTEADAKASVEMSFGRIRWDWAGDLFGKAYSGARLVIKPINVHQEVRGDLRTEIPTNTRKAR